MSFPVQIHGSEGEQFSEYTTQRWPLGTKLILQDGREYRFGKVGGTNVAAARLTQAAVPGANFDELAVPAAVPIGSTTISITNGATTITKDQFAEGYLNVEDDTGEGHLYKIASNAAEAAGSAAFNVVIEKGKRDVATSTDSTGGVLVAWTTSTTVGLTSSPYDSVIIHPSPATAILTGVTPRALTASRYGWLQVRGPASVLTEGTIVAGRTVMPSSSADGAVTPWILTEGTPNVEILAGCGYTMEVAATTEESLVCLAVAGW